MSRYDEMKELMDQLQPDISKFYKKGNKAAGTRARKTLQEMKQKAQDIRMEIQEWKNSGKVDNI